MMPFSSASGVFDWLVKPRTPLTGFDGSCGTLLIANSTLLLRLNLVLEGVTVLILQLGQTESLVSLLQRGHVRNLCVASPPWSHVIEVRRAPHEGQTRLTMSTSTVPSLPITERRFREGPLPGPTGKSVCTGGLRCLSMAFSGLPTRTPTVAVVCLPILIPERPLIISAASL